MPFVITTYDSPDKKHVREEFRSGHYEHLVRYQERLIASGGLRDAKDEEFIGGLIVLNVDSEEEARRFVNEDPFTKANLFDRVTIERWRPAFIEGRRV
jgi:uncharacterized protein YciI